MALRRINVSHLSRVEGHGRIKVDIDERGRVADVRFGIFEGPRFFEALVLGRHYTEVPSLVSRICAICSVGHKITALLALEKALGIGVSRQTELLRDLLHQGMFIESHALHLFFLALPDFVGAGSAMELVPRFPAEVELGLALKKLGNEIQETVGGRAIHPINPVIGGFGRVPSRGDLGRLRAGLEKLLPRAERTLALFRGLDYPGFTAAPTLFFALEPEESGFSYFGARVRSSRGESIPVDDYRKVCAECVVPHSSAKHSLPGGEPFMVGALARVNLFGDRLTPRARAGMGSVFPSDNSLHNNLAQAVELVYCFERALADIEELLVGPRETAPSTSGTARERPASGAAAGPGGGATRQTPAAGPGEGVAATEVPRGTLYHHYRLDEEGRVTYANVVTPTSQNQASVERDFRACVGANARLGDSALAAQLEMIARAYDPCISCAAHMVEVRRV